MKVEALPKVHEVMRGTLESVMDECYQPGVKVWVCDGDEVESLKDSGHMTSKWTRDVL